MVTTEGNLRLIEINYKPSFKRKSPVELAWLSRTMFTGLQRAVIAPVFGLDPVSSEDPSPVVLLYEAARQQ